MIIIYIKRILFLIIALIAFLMILIAFGISFAIMPLYLCVYYVKHATIKGASILPSYVLDFYERFINKINHN